MLMQEHLRSNKIYVGLFLIRRNLSGRVRRLSSLPSHVEGVKEVGETGKDYRGQRAEGKTTEVGGQKSEIRGQVG